MPKHQRLYPVVKRLFDLVLGLIAVIVLAPVFLVIALLIKLDSEGPVLFRQVRVGKNGKEFVCYKFRSMVHNADQSAFEQFVKQAMKGNPDSPKGMNQPFRLKTDWHDPRITRVGRVLRRTTLDELPQLFNVIKGEMSLVGPRPDVPASVEEYTAFERKRLEVLPGMAGLWVASGRANLTVRDMFKLDAKYVDQCSFWTDLKILLKTIPAVIRGEGAG